MTQRLLALIVPDWPALAAAIDADLSATDPVAVMRANRVVSANAPARALGISRNMVTRAARSRCPGLVLAAWDPEGEARLFVAATQALDTAVARFTVLGPGAVSVPADSLQHVHTDEASAVEHLLARLTESTGWEFLPGIADTPFAALLAARTSTRVEAGRTPKFLAAQPVHALEAADLLDETLDPEDLRDLVSVLTRLGLRTLGDLALLDPADVGTRFGQLGMRARELARGLGHRGLRDHTREADLSVEAPLEPPTPRTDVLAFRARSAAAELFAAVRRRALACTQVTIRLTATSGEHHERTWRLEDMDDNRVADRVRWQAEGWLSSRSPRNPRTNPSSAPEDGLGVDEGIALLTLTAAELAAPLETQRSLLDGSSGDVSHSLERVQGLFGPDSVLVPGLQGGRDPGETTLWTPWQQTPRAERDPKAPWPGAIPAPHPVRVLDTPIELLDESGGTVSARPAGLDRPPALLRIPGSGARRIVDHSSAWPVDTGWWDPAVRQYRVRLQVLADDGAAFLVCKEAGRWRLLGEYA
ncbi:DNA polymerase Y family protein [Brevibacterium jeotgali]|uniref:Protein ImuB n=1 Tax=Brevibacterium jeotgali TaxID=1262550 RepID=A0A2H1L1U9_9MICO|nr:DNA polymerase Y family protein [Brevibacterium jeotgali]TWC02865.1 protein ImuB [Brevibacterium jeotgali]SMY10887.1 protein ImuB [Brevibacterium jeotgali]